MRRTFALFILFAIAITAWAMPVSHFTEDFSTTTYRNAVETTANWDTSSQSLKLNNFATNEINSVSAPGIRDCAADGDYLYAITSTNYMIYTVSTILSQAYTSAGLTDGREIELDGELAYIANGTAGLLVIRNDLANLPSTLGSFATAGTARGLDVAGDLAFVCTSNGFLEIVDVQNPAAMSSVAVLNLGGTVYNCDVEGDICYVANGSNGLRVVDISDPAVPFTIATYGAPDAREVVVDGNRAYVADALSSFIVLNISNPLAPTLQHSFSSVVGLQVAVDGNVGLLGTDSQVLDIDDPWINWPSSSTPSGQVSGLHIQGELAFVADLGQGRLRVIEIREPSPAVVESSLDPGGIEDVVIEGEILYASGGFDFFAIDILDETNPTMVGTLVLPGIAGRHDVEGNLAVIPAFDQGVQFVDVSDPTAMAIIGSYDSPGTQFYDAVDVVGDVAYVCVDNELEILDISDPTSPALLATYTLAGSQMQAVVVEGDYAYIAAGTAGLVILNISTPSAPAFTADWNTTEKVLDVVVGPVYAYLADETRIVSINVTDPSNPQALVAINTPGGFTNGIARSRDQLFVSVEDEGVRVYDLSSAGFPNLTQTLNNGTYPRRLAIQGDVLYTAMRFDGMDLVSMMARDFDLEDRIGQSLVVNGTGDDVLAVKLSVVQTSAANEWLVSPDNGGLWYLISTDQWFFFPTPDADLVWRTGLVQDAGHVNPEVSQVDVQMAFEYPVIQSIEDTANDQGKQVRVTWRFSGHDRAGSSEPIHYYDVYRQVDPNLVAPALAPIAPPQNLAASAMPPGWDFVGSTPASGEDEYSLVVPTLADSTIDEGQYMTTFMVRARAAAPTTWFESPPDSGYSVDNLNPSIPANLVAVYQTGSGNQLSWDPASDADWQYFRVYRDVTPDFAIGAGSHVESTANNAWTDPSFDLPGYYYKVTSVDFSGNESDAAMPDTPTGLPEHAAPLKYALEQNVPNPFNPSTTIRYSVPAPGTHVSLTVFDVTGRVVRELVNGAQSSGQKQVQWDGRDAMGAPVASGIYLYRIVAGDFVQSRKMMLIK